MVKRLAQIVLPKADNDGKSLVWVHEMLQKRLCEAYGGFTAVDSYGGWIDPKDGKLYKEEGVLYSVAVRGFNDALALRKIAAWLLIEATQEAIFVVFGDGTIDFITKQEA